jgi:hypothetical protein
MRNCDKPIQGLPGFPGLPGTSGSSSILTNLTVYVDPVFGTVNGKLEDRNAPFNNLTNALNAVRNSPGVVSYHVVLFPGSYTDVPNYSDLADTLTIQSYDGGVFFSAPQPLWEATSQKYQFPE